MSDPATFPPVEELPEEGNPQEDPQPDEFVTPPADPEAEPDEDEDAEPQENADHGVNEPGDEFGEANAVN